MSERNREIIVRGVGKVTAVPDLIRLNMDLSVTEKDYETAMKIATKQLDSLRKAICSVGHNKEDIKTTRFNVSTKYEQYREKENWKSKFVGYVCVHELSLEFDLEMALFGKTLSAISKCTAKPKFSVKFTVKDPSALSQQLLENAVENAKLKAAVLAKAAGVSLCDIVRIDYNWSELHMYSKTDYLVENDVNYSVSENAPMQYGIVPEDINMTETAAITWSIK